MGKLYQAMKTYISPAMEESAKELARRLMTTTEDATEIVIAFAVWKKYGNAFNDAKRSDVMDTIKIAAATNDLKNIMKYATRAQRARIAAQLNEFADVWTGRKKPPTPNTKGGNEHE